MQDGILSCVDGVFRTVVRPRLHGFSAGGLSAPSSSIFSQDHPLLLRRRPVSRRPWTVLGLWSPDPPPEGSARCFVMFRRWYWARGRGRCPSVRCVIHFCRFVLLFSTFLRSTVSRKRRSPRVLVSPGVLGRGRPILGVCGVGSGRRRRSPALNNFWNPSAG